MAQKHLYLALFAATLALAVAERCQTICNLDYTPVCGSDGVTYGNECELASRSCLKQTAVGLAYVGECDPSRVDEVSPPQKYDTEISVPNGADQGIWALTEMCPAGSYPTGIRIKLEYPTNGDDTSLNGIELSCSNSDGVTVDTISSNSGIWGDFMSIQYCPQNMYFKAFDLRVENSAAIDLTAANDINLLCRTIDNSQERVLYGNGNEWGSFGGWSDPCPADEVVCGLRTRVQEDQGTFGDDTAMNDVIFVCCTFEGSETTSSPV